jgi:hypothetical protein
VQTGQGSTGIDPAAFEVMSFDRYGTLIDWETGIVSALRPMLARRSVPLCDDRLLALYADLESRAEQGPDVASGRSSGRWWPGSGLGSASRRPATRWRVPSSRSRRGGPLQTPLTRFES